MWEAKVKQETTRGGFRGTGGPWLLCTMGTAPVLPQETACQYFH